jgi:hypothetical protein
VVFGGSLGGFPTSGSLQADTITANEKAVRSRLLLFETRIMGSPSI